MSSIRVSLLSLGAAASLLGVGCAHTQPVKVSTSAPPAAVTQPAPVATNAAENKPDPEAQAEVDLEKLLQGTVVHFDYDQDLLTAESRQRLDTLAEYLRQKPAQKLRISGNCDERGTEEYNLALGQRRAEVAKKYLAQLGIPSTQIDTVSYGAEKPVDEGKTEQSFAANRRDEFAATQK